MDQLRAWAPNLIVVAALDRSCVPKCSICRNLVASISMGRCCHAGAVRRRYKRAILAGDVETGVTIMKMDPGVDTGAILSRRYIPIPPTIVRGRSSQNLLHSARTCYSKRCHAIFPVNCSLNPNLVRASHMRPCFIKRMAGWISHSLPLCWKGVCGPTIHGPGPGSSGGALF